jgi:hypothetical protein
MKLHTEDIDRGYQEISIELSDPNAILTPQVKHTVKEKSASKLKKEEKDEALRKSEEKLRESDAAVLKLLGL